MILQDLNEEEVKTLSKYVFKELFDSSLHLAIKPLPKANQEPNDDRLKGFAEEILNAKLEKLEEKLNQKNFFLIFFKMARTIDKDYLLQFVDQYYNKQEENFVFCGGLDYLFCKKAMFLEEGLRKKN